MTDFKVVNVPGMLSVPVKSYDKHGNEIPDDGEWHRHTVTTQYVLAEFLVAKGLVDGVFSVDRKPDLIIMRSQLSPAGQAFVRASSDKWLRFIDRIGTTEATMMQKLERRWRTFNEPNAS